MKTRVAIVGPTGYTGLCLIELLARHSGAVVTYLASAREKLPNITDIFPQLLERLPDDVAQCKPIEPAKIAANADVVFLALPHKIAMEYTGPLLDAGLKVIDLSADYRISDVALYEATYNTPHCDIENLKRAVYGLPELNRSKIAKADLVANPGCYPTAAALGIGPLLAKGLVESHDIMINAASGVTGAGRTPKLMTHFPEHNEGFCPYGALGGHRHQPEIEQTLAIMGGQEASVLFVPHLLPVNQGILETIYLEPAADDIVLEELFEAMNEAYSDEPFVRVRKTMPNVKHVAHTNYCDITVGMVKRDQYSRIVVVSAIDNMIKGASGQAIQNMNIMFGHAETDGLL